MCVASVVDCAVSVLVVDGVIVVVAGAVDAVGVVVVCVLMLVLLVVGCY